MLVVDANIAVKFVALERGRDKALERLSREPELIAPRWLLLESGNALWRKARLGEIERQEAKQCLKILPDFFEELVDDAEIVMRAHSLAFELDHWIYDTIYLALALERDIMLLTADRKFANAAKRAGYGEVVELLTWDDQP